MAERNKHMTNQAKDAATDVASTVKNRTEDLATVAKNKAKEVIQEAADLAEPAKEKVQEWANAAMGVAGKCAQTAGEELTFLVRRYPLGALAAGALAGFLLARTLRRS